MSGIPRPYPRPPQSDYERLAYYEAKMNYYGAKLQDVDGGSRDTMEETKKKLIAAKTDKLNYEAKSDVIFLTTEYKTLQSAAEKAAKAAKDATDAEKAAIAASTAAVAAEKTAAAAAINAKENVGLREAAVKQTANTAKRSTEAANKTAAELAEFKKKNDIENKIKEHNKLTSNITSLETALLVDNAGTVVGEVASGVASGVSSAGKAASKAASSVFNAVTGKKPQV